MINTARRYSFTKKDMVSTKYFNWYKKVEDGFLNGSNDLKSKGLKGLEIRIVLQNKSGEKPQNIWSKRYLLSGKSWNLTKPGVLPFLGLEQRLSNGSLNRERFIVFQLSLLLKKSFFTMERQDELREEKIPIISLIHTLRLKRSETFIRQILLDQGISEAQKESPDSIPFTPWMLQAIQPSQVSSLINRLSLCADISLKHGDLWGFQRYPRWIMRCLLQVEDGIPIASPSLSDFICFWEFIWYSSPKKNLEEMHLSRVLMPSGKRGCLEDIIVLPLLPSKEPLRDSCGIIILNGFKNPQKGERRIIPMRSLSKKSKKVIEKSMKEFMQRNSLVELTKVGARMMIQIALEEELRAFLGRDYYDRRSAGQEGSRAGSKPRTIKIGYGDIELEMPKVKDTGGPFHSERYYMIGR